MDDVISSKDHGLLFKGDMVNSALDSTKTETRRLITANNSLIDGYGGGVHGLKKKDIFAMPGFLSDSFIDSGPSPAGNEGPYLKCPINQFDTIHRVYPRVQVGDRIWVKETFVLENTCEYHGDHLLPSDGRPVKEVPDGEGGCYCLIPHYRATEPEPNIVPYDCTDDGDDRTRWSSSMFMPRWASRILLEVTAVWPERLQDITYGGARAEGVGRSWDGAAYWYKNYFGGVSGFKRDPVKSYISLWNSINGFEDWESNPLVWVYQFKRVVN